MQARAQLFRATARWISVAAALAVLWFGFRLIFTEICLAWYQMPSVVADPSRIDAFFNGSTPAAVNWTLASFAIYTGLLMLVLQVLHRVGLAHLFGPLRLAWPQFWRVSLYLAPLYALLVLPAAFAPEAEQQYPMLVWLSFLPVTLVMLFVQISSEELIFRGYLQSHFAALSRHPIVWMGIPSFLFGMIHFDPLSPGYSAWGYVVWAMCLGLVCADLTARSGSLGPALAVHFVNNFGAIAFLASDNWLYGAALFIWPMHGQAWEPWIPYEALMLSCVWLTARLALRR